VKHFGGWKSATLNQLYSFYDPIRLGAVPKLRMDLMSEPDVKLIDFFGATDSIRAVPRTHSPVSFSGTKIFPPKENSLTNLPVFTRHDEPNKEIEKVHSKIHPWNHWISLATASVLVMYILVS
jgi:hypothetical protein